MDQSAASAVPPPATLASSGERRLAVIQFFRRVVILLIAYLILRTVLGGWAYATYSTGNVPPQLTASQREWPEAFEISWVSRRPIADIVVGGWYFSAWLSGAAFTLSLCIVPVAVAGGLAVHRMTARGTRVHTILRAAGRVWLYLQIAWPPIIAGLTLLLILAVGLHLFPAGQAADPRVSRAGEILLSDRLYHLVLPALAMALMPCAVITLTVIRVLTHDAAYGVKNLLGNGLLVWGERSFGMAAGWLAIQILVETIFTYPGLGLQLLNASITEDYPVVFAVVTVMALMVLIGRLIAEAFGALRRVVNMPANSSTPSVQSPQPTRRWTLAGLIVLIIPLCALLSSLIHPMLMNTVWDRDIFDPITGFDVSLSDYPSPPSATHALGTDPMSRDILSQLMFSGASSLVPPLNSAFAALLIGVVFGGLSGALAARRSWWAETLSDVLLLPADIGLLVPPLAMLMLLAASTEVSVPGVTAAMVVLLAPRVSYAYRSFWVDAPADHAWRTRLLIGPAALLLGGAFVGLWNIETLNFFGMVNVRMSWGLMLWFTQQAGYLLRSSWMIWAPVFAWWASLLGLSLGADTLNRYAHNADALFHLSR